MFDIKTDSKKDFSSANYHIILLDNKERFSIDFVEYISPKPSILFVSPYQNVAWICKNPTAVTQICFHADYYCIAYHKKEVACNGILFNNIYLNPFVSIKESTYQEIKAIVEKMKREMSSDNPFSESIIKTYLQLILAICSKEKSIALNFEQINTTVSKEVLSFQHLLEIYFLTERSVAFYASKLALSPNSFSKKIKQQLIKTPTQLIQERVVLEAKKLLHLTHKSVKEIAFELNFEDEFYFSRYFKKSVGLSPLHYRKNVGISIAAK